MIGDLYGVMLATSEPGRALVRYTQADRTIVSAAHAHRWRTLQIRKYMYKHKTNTHLTCITAPRASTWKSVIPSCKLHVLVDAYYRIAARLSLALPPYRNRLPDDCASCGAKAAIRDDSWHHLSCNAHKRREINIRHDTVVHALYTHATQSGAAAVKEPVGLSTEDGRRPDLQIVIPGESLLTDVVVSHPLCPTHLAPASKEHLATARSAELRKHRNYADVADAQCARFLPFSAETTGGLGKDAEELIDQISLACRDHLALPSHYHIANGVRASVAIAVQKGNALAIFGGYSRAVKHAGQPHAAA